MKVYVVWSSTYGGSCAGVFFFKKSAEKRRKELGIYVCKVQEHKINFGFLSLFA